MAREEACGQEYAEKGSYPGLGLLQAAPSLGCVSLSVSLNVAFVCVHVCVY